MRHKVKNKDEGHDQWADIAPRDLPEDVGLVADHKLNVVVKPAGDGRGEVEEERGRDIRSMWHTLLVGDSFDTCSL